MKSISKKTSPIVLIALLIGALLISFNSMSQVPQLSEQEKEPIKEEISALVGTIIEGANQQNIEAFMQSFAKSEDFLQVKTNGSFVGYNGMEYEVNEFFKGVKSLKYVKHDEGFRFITNTHVLYTWVGHYEAIGIEGRAWEVKDFVGTFLLAKINNEWKATYLHLSASKPILEESN